MNRLSLLERLGGKPPERKVPSPAVTQENLPVYQPEVKSPPKDEDVVSSRDFVQNETPVMASSFVGKRITDAQSKAVQELKIAIHRRIVNEMTPDEQRLLSQGESVREQVKNIISAYCTRELTENTAYTLTRAERQILIEDICNELLGLGPLEPLLKDDSITEIMVNGAKNIFIEQQGKLKRTDVYFYNDAHLMGIIERILAPLGRRVDEFSPLVDARLSDGSRVNIIIPPLSLIGPAITIRKFSKNALSMNDLIGFGTLDENMAKFLQACVKARLNILVSGGTGSGKTTTLNALSCFIPETDRIVTIEDAAELKLQQNHVVTLESRPANLEGKGAITIRDLVKNALRMRPDRIIVGAMF